MITTYASLGMTMLRLWAGKLLNAIGVPGVVQPGTYEAGIGQVSVRVTVGPLFTVMTVNGVDVYFDRFTGTVDGVGFGVASGCTLADPPRPAASVMMPTMVAAGGHPAQARPELQPGLPAAGEASLRTS
jgi:hypothetical protein